MNVGIIVDHPTRDLPGLAILSEKIVNDNKNKVILIPMYKLAFTLRYFPKKFDVIVFNFLRDSNKKYVHQAHKYGIKTIIYDQEGVGGIKGMGLMQILPKIEDHLVYVDTYCFWGTNQMETFKSSTVKKNQPKSLIVSGWLNSDYIYKKNKELKKDRKTILINSNFASCDPKFNSLKSEIKGRVNTINISKSEVSKRMSYIYKRKLDFIKSVEMILNFFPNYEFLLRPHPYEDDTKYLELGKKFKNCEVSGKDSINEVLLKTKLFIHVDCTTAVNCNFLKIPSISLDWIIADKKNEVYNAIANDVSIHSKNIIDCKELIEKYYNKVNLNEYNSKLLSKYYGKFDGKRCENLAEKINDIVLVNKNNKKMKFSLKENVKFFIFDIMGEKTYTFLRKLILNKKFEEKRSIEKKFFINDVKKYLVNNNLKLKNLPFGCIEIKL